MDTALKDLHDIIEQQLQAEALVATKEEELKQAKAVLRALQEDMVPSAFDNAGLTKVENDLYKVSLKEDMTVRTLKDNKPECVAWLREQDLGELVATTFSVPFGKNKDNEIGEFRGILKDGGFGFTEITDFNSGSVKAQLKKLLAKNKKVPLELFGAEQYRKAIIKIKED